MWYWIIPDQPEYLALAIALFKDRVIIPTDINQAIFCRVDDSDKKYIENLFTYRLGMSTEFEKAR